MGNLLCNNLNHKEPQDAARVKPVSAPIASMNPSAPLAPDINKSYDRDVVVKCIDPNAYNPISQGSFSGVTDVVGRGGPLPKPQIISSLDNTDTGDRPLKKHDSLNDLPDNFDYGLANKDEDNSFVGGEDIASDDSAKEYEKYPEFQRFRSHQNVSSFGAGSMSEISMKSSNTGNPSTRKSAIFPGDLDKLGVIQLNFAANYLSTQLNDLIVAGMKKSNIETSPQKGQYMKNVGIFIFQDPAINEIVPKLKEIKKENMAYRVIILFSSDMLNKPKSREMIVNCCKEQDVVPIVIEKWKSGKTRKIKTPQEVSQQIIQVIKKAFQANNASTLSFIS
jgi:hypothetical protein